MTMTVKHGDRVLWKGPFDAEKIALIAHDYPTRVDGLTSITVEITYP